MTRNIIFIAAIAALSIATSVSAEPPRDRDRQANCSKGFYKYRGKCWRKIDQAEDLEADDRELELERLVDRKLEELELGRKQ